jgi:hypothetical protein
MIDVASNDFSNAKLLMSGGTSAVGLATFILAFGLQDRGLTRWNTVLNGRGGSSMIPDSALH